MAMFEKIVRDGIQMGEKNDFCLKCIKPFEKIDKTLENEEIFKIHINGLQYCLCLDHFQELLGDYVLVHKDTLVEGKDYIEIPSELIKNGTEEEVINYIKKATRNE